MKHSCFVHRIGGMEDYVHILVEIPAKHAVAEVIKIIKQETSKAIRNSFLIREWDGWEVGYSAFTCSYRELDMLKNYIINQKEHHKHLSFKEEYRQWLIENGIDESDPYFPR